MQKPTLRLRAGTGDDALGIAALATQVFLDTYATDGVFRHLAVEAFTEYSVEAFHGTIEGAFYARLGYEDLGPGTYTCVGETYGTRILAKRLTSNVPA